jgi:hypothetical protein
MKTKLYSVIFMILIAGTIELIAQTEHEKYGCKYVKSKMKLRDFTESELKYAEDLEFRSDTFDILNYRINIDVTDFSGKKIQGRCDIDFSPRMSGLDYILFDLLEMKVDSVVFNSNKINFKYTSPFLRIDFDNFLESNDTFRVSVFYNGISKIDPSGFGGFYFEKSYAFNLGIGLASIPHNYGRSWFPCFDNFVERSTYDFDIVTQAGHYAYCVGDYIGLDTMNNGKKIFHFRMEQQIPTYQAGVAVADYREINWNFEGTERNIPIQLVGKPQDTLKMKTSFAYLPFAIETFEKWYGPYQWNRVGYVLTSNGAMEHPTNIAFPDFLGNNGDPEVTMDIMAHELAHHWWGDLTTLTTAYDMWIKEGTSEYASHQFIEDFYGQDRFREVMKENSYEVITTAHVRDKEYRALSGMPMEFTYGPTTYNKGAMVIHNLRTYMGDSLFMTGMRSILKNYAYGHLNASQFQQELEISTGLDMDCFFKDWIYAPGFNSFEIDSAFFNQSGTEIRAQLFVEQKLHYAPHYHCNVPLEITFYNDNLEKYDVSVIVSGQNSIVETTIPFYPAFWTINENQRLNNSQLGGNYYFYRNKSYTLKREKVTIKTPDLVPDSVFMRVEHTWGQPDPVKEINPGQYMRISNSHYWTISGKIPENNTMTANFFYNGSNSSELDFDLANISEDSIMIVYRADAGQEWKLHPNIQKQKLVPKDGRGNVIITGLLPGQYAFANYAGTTKVSDALTDNIQIYPNPAKNILYLTTDENIKEPASEINIFSIDGKKALTTSIAGNSTVKIDVSGLTNGIYILQLTGKDDRTIKSQKIIIDQQ